MTEAMTLHDEFLSYPHDRATAYLRKLKMSWNLYGAARWTKAVLTGSTWEPAPRYNDDGSIDHGIDVLLYPLIDHDEVVNIIAIDPTCPDAVYLRHEDTNIWDLMDLLSALQTTTKKEKIA